MSAEHRLGVRSAIRTGRCPDCDVDLEDDGLAVRCWKCGWEVRDVDAPRDYVDIADMVAYFQQPPGRRG